MKKRARCDYQALCDRMRVQGDALAEHLHMLSQRRPQKGSSVDDVDLLTQRKTLFNTLNTFASAPRKWPTAALSVDIPCLGSHTSTMPRSGSAQQSTIAQQPGLSNNRVRSLTISKTKTEIR